MYSREDKLKAVELFIKYDYSPQSAIDELGYPSRGSLYNWYREYLGNEGDIPAKNPYRRYGDEQGRAAVGHCFEHGKCLARTCRMPGYPSKELLAAWIDELEPGRRKANRAMREITECERENAVIRLTTGKGSAQAIADDMGVKRLALYDRKRKLLGEGALPEMPAKKRKGMGIEELEKPKAALEADIDKLELERAILEGTVELLGKGRGADPETLASREKTLLVESLRPAHRLKDLLDAVGLAKGSHRYQMAAMAKPDKYAELRMRIYENDASATLVSMGFSSSFNPLGPDYGDRATVIFRDKGSEAQVHVSTMLFEKDGRLFLDFDAPSRTALIATDLSGRDILFMQRDGTLGEKFEAMEKALGITPQGEKREPSDPPFSFDAAVQAFQEWEPGGTGKGDAELDPIAAMNRRHLSRLGRPRTESAPADRETPKRRDRSLER